MRFMCRNMRSASFPLILSSDPHNRVFAAQNLLRHLVRLFEVSDRRRTLSNLFSPFQISQGHFTLIQHDGLLA